MEEKYHLVVTVAYSFVIAVIVCVLAAPIIERLAIWIVGVILISSALWRIRKGAEPPKQFDLHS